MDDENVLGVYADPVIYDLETGEHDVADSILLNLADQAAGPILELGCGTGRLTIPLAKRGLDLTGLDILPHMIDRAREKAAGLDIRWICDDVRHFQLDGRYGLIFTAGAVLQHLLRRVDQEAMLARVGEHLAPGGRFVLDASFKRPDKMVDVDEPVFWYSFSDEDGRPVDVYGTDHYDHLGQIWTQTLYRRWREGEQEGGARPATIVTRYFMPQELQSLLRYNGFAVLEKYGSWQGEPLTEESDMQIYLCQYER
jgi:SAM-dependent methyltransferase